MSRPSIGITSYWAPAAMGVWRLDAAYIAQGYVEGVRLAGGRALVLPPDPLWEHDPGDALDLLDGLVVAGGEDVGADLYGHDPTRAPRPSTCAGTRRSWGCCAAPSSAACRCSQSAAASSS
jgi:gamma-glutamyl-gamma-aminobutyrate hydrolase PuuD